MPVDFVGGQPFVMVPLNVTGEFFATIGLNSSEQRITQPCRNTFWKWRKLNLLDALPVQCSKSQFLVHHLDLSAHVVISLTVYFNLHAVLELKPGIASANDENFLNVSEL